MILYAKTKTEFLSDLAGGAFLSELETAYTATVGPVSEGERRAWENSVCKYMKQVLEFPGIADNIGVAVEYQIPGAPERIDMMLSGQNVLGKTVILIIELKQWTGIEESDRQFGYVILDAGANRDIRIHPSYQAYCYKQWISLSMRDECRERVELHGIGWLHNYVPAGDADPIYAKAYKKFAEDAPLYFSGDGEKLAQAIAGWMPRGDDGEGIRLLEENCVGSSRALQDAIESLLKGNKEFVLSKDQMMVYGSIERYFLKANRTKEKKVLIVNGGPGTGKSVVAAYSLAKLYARYAENGIRCYYLSKNRAPRQVYCKMLAGDDVGVFKKFFVDTGFFTRGKAGAIRSALSVVDESHRIVSEEEVAHIIEASAVSVFFIDEDQVVSLEDAGTIAGIKDYCAKRGYECIDDIRLKSQFRCSGSDAYVNWVDELLGIRKASVRQMDYDISVYDSFERFYSDMQAKNGANKARIVAGDCWEWKSRNDLSGKMTDLTIEGKALRWNNKDGIWAIGEGSFEQIGCIHTCQGLDFDYVGVIIGPDLVYQDGEIRTDYNSRAKDDNTLSQNSRDRYAARFGVKKMEAAADRIIRNTYRVLLTRGLKGCKVYCMDPALGEYIRSEIERRQRR